MTDQSENIVARIPPVVGAWFEHDDARIYYEKVGSGPTLLMLPGLAGNIDEFVPLRQIAAEKGMTVIAADLPGSGKSLPQPRAYTRDYHAQDAAAFAAFIEHLQAGPAVLVGFSDGGEVALIMAAEYPALVRGVMVWGACGSIDDPHGAIAAFFSDVIDNPHSGGEGYRDYLIGYYGIDVARASMQSAGDALAAIDRDGGDISRSIARQITCPTLLIAGDADRFVLLSTLHEFNAQVVNGRVLVLEGGGHSLHQTHAHFIADTLHAFLFSLNLHTE